MSSRMQTQLVNYKDFNPKKMSFSKPRLIVNPKYSGHRIFINYKNPDGSVGDLVLGLPTMYSMGIRNGRTEEDDANTPPKYSLPLCLYDRDGATKEQLEVEKTFEKIGEAISDHIMKIKKEIKKPKIGTHNLVKTCPLSWKLDDEGEKDTEAGPKIWPQLYIDYKTKKLKTLLYDDNGNDVDYDACTGRGAMVTSCIKVQSIWVKSDGNSSTKLTVYEAKMSFFQNSCVSFLGRPEPIEENEEEENEEEENEDKEDEQEEEDEEEGSL